MVSSTGVSREDEEAKLSSWPSRALSKIRAKEEPMHFSKSLENKA
jgi:hypothetical protein